MSEAINLYGGGGAAVKITKDLHGKIDLPEGDIVPEIKFMYMDTSNTESSILSNDSMLHVIDTGNEMSGSGGIRAANYPEISKQVPVMMREKLPPAKINFVLFHSGGGSGAAIAFTVIKELLNRDTVPIVFITNTSNTLHRCSNATKTMKSLDTIAKRHDVVLPAFITDTTDFDSYKEANVETIKNILMTATMFNQDVISVDDADRKNIINPKGMPDSTIYAGLHELSIINGDFEKPDEDVISIFSLVPDGTDDDVGSGAEFIFSGVLTPEMSSGFYTDNKGPVSIYTKTNTVNKISENMVKKIDKIKSEKEQVRQMNECAVSDKIETSESVDDMFL